MSRTDARHLRAVPPVTPDLPEFSDVPPTSEAADERVESAVAPVPDIDDIELPELSPHTKSVFDQMDALLDGLPEPERLAALKDMRFGADGTPSLPPNLHAVPDTSGDTGPAAVAGTEAPTTPDVPFSDIEPS